ncbi:MAG: DUF1566 domain-containing protein [Treponema sp.]|nr:DUF1566 domain-containing protein [Treponema sp.]
MKSKIKFFGSFFLVVVIGFTFITCDPEGGDPACTHIAGNTPPCTTAQSCTKCGNILQAKLGHDHISSLICKRDGCDHQYALGDTGPAGGKIIYVAPTGFTVTSTTSAFTTYTAYYIEAAPTNAGSSIRWSTQSSSPFPNVTGTLETIGSGRNNTALIIAAEQTAHPSNAYIYAALACDNYSVASFNDWFLPSRNELNQLYLRRADFSITTGLFWSSSQVDFDYAWRQNFDNSVQIGNGKNGNHVVRAVRAF